MQISVLLPLLIQLNQARLEEKYIFSVDRWTYNKASSITCNGYKEDSKSHIDE